METKNGILAKQKEMQTSLEKVKHLVRLIHSFSLSSSAELEAPHNENKTDSSQEPKGTSNACTNILGSGQNLAQVGAQVPAAGTVPNVQTEPEVGELADLATAVTPDVEPRESTVTSNTPASDQRDVVKLVKLVQVTDIKANGDTDSRSNGKEEKDNVKVTNPENLTLGKLENSEEAGTMEVDEQEDVNHAKNTNNGKPTEPLHQILSSARSLNETPLQMSTPLLVPDI